MCDGCQTGYSGQRCQTGKPLYIYYLRPFISLRHSTREINQGVGRWNMNHYYVKRLSFKIWNYVQSLINDDKSQKNSCHYGCFGICQRDLWNFFGTFENIGGIFVCSPTPPLSTVSAPQYQIKFLLCLWSITVLKATAGEDSSAGKIAGGIVGALVLVAVVVVVVVVILYR